MMVDHFNLEQSAVIGVAAKILLVTTILTMCSQLRKFSIQTRPKNYSAHSKFQNSPYKICLFQ